MELRHEKGGGMEDRTKGVEGRVRIRGQERRSKTQSRFWVGNGGEEKEGTEDREETRFWWEHRIGDRSGSGEKRYRW